MSWIKFSGYNGPSFQVRAEHVIAVSGVYGNHGDTNPDSLHPKLFGPFVDVLLSGGQVITLENCSSAYDDNMGTDGMIVRQVREALSP